MAYVDIATLQTIAAGQPLSAATVQQIRDNDEFLIDPPACSVYNAGVTVSSSVTLGVLAAGSENYDNNSMHSTSVNTSRITAQTAGRYEIGCVVQYGASGTGNRNTVIRLNGSVDHPIDLRAGTGTNTNTISGSRTLVLAAGNYVEVAVWQNSGGDLTVTLTEFYAIFRTR